MIEVVTTNSDDSSKTITTTTDPSGVVSTEKVTTDTGGNEIAPEPEPELAKKLNIKENTLNKLIKDLERDGILNISKNKYIEIKGGGVTTGKNVNAGLPSWCLEFYLLN